MPGNVTFAFDSADLNAQFYPVLDKVAGTLKEYDKTVIEVAGHTDSVGSDTYNQTPLTSAAPRASRPILSSHGVTGTRVVTIGAGEAHPVASNDTEEGRAQNRRVEITIVPVTQESRRAGEAGLTGDAADPGPRIRGRLDVESGGFRRRQLPQLPDRVRLDLADALGGHAVLRRPARAASPSDSPIQRARRIAWLRASSCVIASATRSLVSSSHSARSTAIAGIGIRRRQIGRRRIALLLVVVVRRRVVREVARRQSPLHLGDFALGHAELARHVLRLFAGSASRGSACTCAG